MEIACVMLFALLLPVVPLQLTGRDALDNLAKTEPPHRQFRHLISTHDCRDDDWTTSDLLFARALIILSSKGARGAGCAGVRDGVAAPIR
jgi:hypothetical protein